MFSALLRELLAARESAGSDDGMEVEAYEEDDGGPDSFDCDDPIPLPEEPVSSTNQAEPSGMAAAPSLCVCQQSPEMPSAALHGDVEGPSVCPPSPNGQQPAATAPFLHASPQSPEMPSAALHRDVEGLSVFQPAPNGQQPAAAAPFLHASQQSPEMPSAALHGDVEGPSVCPPASEGQQPAAATSSEHNCCIHRGLKNKLPGDVVRCFNRLFSTPMKMNEGLR